MEPLPLTSCSPGTHRVWPEDVGPVGDQAATLAPVTEHHRTGPVAPGARVARVAPQARAVRNHLPDLRISAGVRPSVVERHLDPTTMSWPARPTAPWAAPHSVLGVL